MTSYAFYPFAGGYLKVGYAADAVTYLKCVRAAEDVHAPSAVSDLAYAQIHEYWNGQRKTFDFPYVLHGTAFQHAAWRALCDIPYGETRTYKEIAAAIGKPSACRAVGMANRQNPLWIAVPCHRVIGANGSLTGYAGGLAMKRALLDLEHKRDV